MVDQILDGVSFRMKTPFDFGFVSRWICTMAEMEKNSSEEKNQNPSYNVLISYFMYLRLYFFSLPEYFFRTITRQICWCH